MNDEMMMRMNPFVPLPQPRPVPMPQPDPRARMMPGQPMPMQTGPQLTPQLLMELLGSTFNNRGQELKF